MINDGNYYIFALTTGTLHLVLDVPGGRAESGVLIQQYGFHGGAWQQWTITNVGDNFYTIVSVHTGKALDVPGGYPIPALPIQQYTLHGGSNQQWKIETHPAVSFGGLHRPEFHRVFNKHTGMALDIPSGSTRWHEIIQQYPPHSGWNQAWILAKV